MKPHTTKEKLAHRVRTFELVLRFVLHGLVGAGCLLLIIVVFGRNGQGIIMAALSLGFVLGGLTALPSPKHPKQD